MVKAYSVLALLSSYLAYYANGEIPIISPPESKAFSTDSIASGLYEITRLDTIKLEQAENICKGSGSNMYVVSPNDDIKMSKTYAMKIESDGKIVSRREIYHGGKTESWGSPQSCAVSKGVVAVAVVAPNIADKGRIYFYKESNLKELGYAEVGPLPDMVGITPDGNKWVVGIEAEPNATLYDPVGGISIIDVKTRKVECEFSFDMQISEETYRANKIHRTRRAVPTNVDLEPEYITFDPADSTKAYVGLQEGNTFLVVSLDKNLPCTASSRILSINPLGWKNWNLVGNELDASDRDLDGKVNKIGNFRNLPVYGMYQPDTIVGFRHNDEFYIVSANEGDGKSPEDFEDAGSEGPTNMNGDEMKFSSVVGVDNTMNWAPFTPANIKENINLGRAAVVNSEGDEDNRDGIYKQIVMEGGRSFSIWKITTQSTELVYDSSSFLDKMALKYCQDNNLMSTPGTCYDPSREDNKGTEPETVELLYHNGKRLLIVGLERANILALFDISEPTSPKFIQFFRDELNAGGESPNGLSAPEGIRTFSAATSPTGEALIVVSGEASSTVTVFKLKGPGCDYGNPKVCNAVAGCKWKKGSCSAVIPCSGLSMENCKKEKSCRWDSRENICLDK